MGTNADGVKEVDPSPAKAGLWEDFVDIFCAPSSVFARRSDEKFGIPLLILAIVAGVLVFVTKNAMQPVMDAEFARQSAAAIRKNPGVTAEQLATGRNFFEMLGPIFFAVILTISVLGTGVVLWLVGKLFDNPDTASPVMIALASRVDLFTIWVTVLLAIGLHVVGKIPKQQAAIVAAITWVVGALLPVFGALRAS